MSRAGEDFERRPSWLNPTADDKKRAELLGTFMGMVLTMCRQLGLSDAETAKVFSPENIRAGFAILDSKGKQ